MNRNEKKNKSKMKNKFQGSLCVTCIGQKKKTAKNIIIMSFRSILGPMGIEFGNLNTVYGRRSYATDVVYIKRYLLLLLRCPKTAAVVTL